VPVSRSQHLLENSLASDRGSRIFKHLENNVTHRERFNHADVTVLFGAGAAAAGRRRCDRVGLLAACYCMHSPTELFDGGWTGAFNLRFAPIDVLSSFSV
jgi:hypothetical protein